MSHQSFNSEAQFEEAVVAMLSQYGWDDKAIENPSEEELIRNWADILFENNRHAVRLGDYPLTDTEMQQIVDNINALKTPVALNEFINGGSTSIRRDNPDDVENYGKEVTLKLFDRNEIAGGDSSYQIVRQPKFPTASPLLHNRRGDLMLLINGMPVIHIELKKSGVDVSQAVNQIEKYSKEGIFRSGLFSMIQIFVAMTPEETLYFANPGPDGEFNKQFMFHWADFYNEPLNDWTDIVKSLLSIPMAHQLVGYYTIPDKKDGVLKVMRSYQYYAANAISTKVAKTHWDEKNQYGGYIWHTTGSGKTMTSFKSAQLIAQSGDADKVVFLMDRIELGTQSLEEYKGFAGDADNVEGTSSTDDLVAKLESDAANLRLIVTSIQKMGLVHDNTLAAGPSQSSHPGYPKERLDRIRAKRIVFIIDECHRSTFGETLTGIKRNFPGALFFGFTGTPIAEENNVRDMTTSDLFGERLHLYSIADGIRDENVLGFDPYKVLTFSDGDVREAVALERAKAGSIAEAMADPEKRRIYKEVMDLPMISREKDPASGSYCPGVEDYLPNSQYLTEGHRKEVVKDILKEIPRLSMGGKFHAILATSSIPEAIAYYRLLRKKNPALKVTAVFDPSIDNNGTDRAMIKEEGLIEILSDYNEWYHQSFGLPTWQKFKKDVAKRMAHKKPYQRIDKDMQLDVMIVVDQMLTGFDSKYVNTLYLDKVLTFESLIQAFSRTNRLYGHEKRFGIVRYYRRPHRMERNIENAFRLYAHGRPAGIFVSKIGENIQAINDSFRAISYIFERAGRKGFESLPAETAVRAKFAKEWRILNAYLDAARMQGFSWDKKRYAWKDSEEKLHIATIALDQSAYSTLAQRYKELYAGRKGSHSGDAHDEVPFEIEPHLVEIDTGHIDTAYMNSRFTKFIEAFYDDEESDAIDELRRELHNSFSHLSATNQKFAKIILDDILQGRLPRESIAPSKSLSEYIEDYKANAKNDQIHRFASSIGVDEAQLRKVMALHLPERQLNQGGHFQELIETLDKSKAKELLRQANGGVPVLPFQLKPMVYSMIREFVIRGGFDLEEYLSQEAPEMRQAADD